MKISFLIFLLTIYFYSSGQITVAIEKDITFPDLKVRISDDIVFPDIKVKIGYKVIFEDITIGFTTSKSRADFIITTNPFPNKKVLYGKNVDFKDLQICASENVDFPDITIKIKNNGSVNYSIYTEKDSTSIEEIVICLIDVIKAKMKNNR